jgi:GDPmannose 4,6-dehydratase
MEIYNLGAQSHVAVSFDVPEYTLNVNGFGALRILETIRNLDFPVRYYQASSSEMFGKVLEIPQKETTPFNPQSPYGLSKVMAYYLTKMYRSGYGVVAALKVLEIMQRSGKRLSELKKVVSLFPQVKENVRVSKKEDLKNFKEIQDEISSAEKILGLGLLLCFFLCRL